MVFTTPTHRTSDVHGGWALKQVAGFGVLEVGFNCRGSRGRNIWLALMAGRLYGVASEARHVPHGTRASTSRTRQRLLRCTSERMGLCAGNKCLCQLARHSRDLGSRIWSYTVANRARRSRDEEKPREKLCLASARNRITAKHIRGHERTPLSAQAANFTYRGITGRQCHSTYAQSSASKT